MCKCADVQICKFMCEFADVRMCELFLRKSLTNKYNKLHRGIRTFAHLTPVINLIQLKITNVQFVFKQTRRGGF